MPIGQPPPSHYRAGAQDGSLLVNHGSARRAYRRRMDAIHRGNGLLASIWGAAGVFLLGFAGSELLFAPGAEGIGLEATLLPSAAAAIIAFAYLLAQPAAEPSGQAESDAAASASPLQVVSRAGASPPAAGSRRAA